MNRTTLSELKKKALRKKSVKKQYESLAPAYQLCQKLIVLRQQAGLTQEQIAHVLHTPKKKITCLENANSSNSPKLALIEQYADAVGYDIEINFVPRHHT
ncbi:MAG: helix-turn-helix domain-containing protein [Thiomargarita sp.]|nr:helix-turn-helix domain-containing protein [Thiomargarita sp.]